MTALSPTTTTARNAAEFLYLIQQFYPAAKERHYGDCSYDATHKKLTYSAELHESDSTKKLLDFVHGFAKLYPHQATATVSKPSKILPFGEMTVSVNESALHDLLKMHETFTRQAKDDWVFANTSFFDATTVFQAQLKQHAPDASSLNQALKAWLATVPPNDTVAKNAVVRIELAQIISSAADYKIDVSNNPAYSHETKQLMKGFNKVISDWLKQHQTHIDALESYGYSMPDALTAPLDNAFTTILQQLEVPAVAVVPAPKVGNVTHEGPTVHAPGKDGAAL